MIYLRTCRLGLSGSECQKYAVVYEKIAGVERPTIVCSGSLRTRIVYLSQSNSVVIETFGGATVDDDDVTGDVKTSRHADDMSLFLLKYQGIIFRYISNMHFNSRHDCFPRGSEFTSTNYVVSLRRMSRII